jgi:hypothetical protein
MAWDDSNQAHAYQLKRHTMLFVFAHLSKLTGTEGQKLPLVKNPQGSKRDTQSSLRSPTGTSVQDVLVFFKKQPKSALTPDNIRATLTGSLPTLTAPQLELLTEFIPEMLNVFYDPKMSYVSMTSYSDLFADDVNRMISLTDELAPDERSMPPLHAVLSRVDDGRNGTKCVDLSVIGTPKLTQGAEDTSFTIRDHSGGPMAYVVDSSYHPFSTKYALNADGVDRALRAHDADETSRLGSVNEGAFITPGLESKTYLPVSLGHFESLTASETHVVLPAIPEPFESDLHFLEAMKEGSVVMRYPHQGDVVPEDVMAFPMKLMVALTKADLAEAGRRGQAQLAVTTTTDSQTV